MKHSASEGLKTARLLMVISSFSPLFVLWAIRGTRLIPDLYFVTACAAMIAVPNLVLYARIRIATKRADTREIAIGSSDDHRAHLFIYLFAVLLPLYSETMATWRDLLATLAALVLVVWLFWYMSLHYVNVIFALCGYRVFTVYPPSTDNPLSGTLPCVVITRRTSLQSGSTLMAYRLSNTVLVEAKQ